MKFIILMVWVLMLSWATHFVASPTWRTPITSSEILVNSDVHDPSNWMTKGPESEIVANTAGAIYIDREADKRRRIWQTIALPENTTLLRFQANLRTDSSSIDRFDWNWEPPVVLFLRVLEGQQRYPLSERPMFFQSSIELDEVVELEMPHDTIELSFLKPPRASWQLSNVSLSTVVQHPRYSESRHILAALWLVTLCAGAYRAWRRARFPTLVVVGILTAVLGGIMASKELVGDLFTLMRNSMNSLGGDITSTQFSSIMQSGHIVLFAVLTFVVLVFHKHWDLFYTEVVVGIGVLAIATEALQRHALGRSPDIQDFLLDIVGIFVALAIYGVLRGLFKTSKRLLGEPS